jgi:hypothetical protein
MPAASPKLFACYVTVVTHKLALDTLLNLSQVSRYRFPQQNEAVAQMTARAAKSALELVGEFLFGATRQVRPKKHPIEYLPLPFSKRASFFSPVRHRARTDCVFSRNLAIRRHHSRCFFFLSSSHRKKTAVSTRSSSSLTLGLAHIAKMFCCTA